ncbi:unnamed protein product, partial [Closterium sp. NIES-53]
WLTPQGGPVVAHSSTVLSCPAVPSGSLSGLHPPSFSTNLVSTAALQDAMVTTTTLGGQRVLICTCTRTGRHLATFTHRPGSSMYTLATEPPQVAASAQVSASGPGREHYFLLVVDDYTRYTSIFPLRSKGEVPDFFIPWIREVRLELREWFCEDLPFLRLHSDRGAQPLAPYLLAEELTYTALEGGGWRCVGVLGLGFFFTTPPRAVSSPQDVTFDESVPFYRLFPYRSAPPPPSPLFLAPAPRPRPPPAWHPRYSTLSFLCSTTCSSACSSCILSSCRP